ncbi:D-alanyl-D-alanine endopeptidase [Bordetella sp. FB-8]|uniref:D-alanyl-D-alanine endopeptidase n=1 Tax=Bordetella sp. FB-8 TaxID=1159870 RepID=UPI0003600046|nr:D-alanyl-D-alanine endopeptidase [Bordetella sp. FB-8]
MAFQWVRTAALTSAAMSIAMGALWASPALAASPTPAYCKKHPTTAACKTAAKKAPVHTAAKKPAASHATAKAATIHRAPAKAKARAAAVETRKTHLVRKVALKEHKGRKVIARRAPLSAAALLAAVSTSPGGNDAASLRSSSAYVQDMQTSTVLFEKNPDVVRPIASISKLMTALVVLDAHQPLDQMIRVTDADIDWRKHTGSRLSIGTELSRIDMLHLALMASENRAANALGRNWPGGLPAFVQTMNAKARELGMFHTHFVEPTGLSYENVSSPHDLVLLLRAASKQPLIHQFTTSSEYTLKVKSTMMTFRNTDMLVRRPDWDIKVSKTGFINEAGECLVMMAKIDGHEMGIVLLDSHGTLSRIGDAIRIRRILERQIAML